MGSRKATSVLSPLLFLALTFYAESTDPTPGPSSNSTIVCNAKERAALLRFKDGLIDPSGWLSSWRGPTCCHWTGVTCDEPSGHVTAIELTSPEFCTDYTFGGDSSESYTPRCLSGELSKALLDMEHLQYLDLSNNNFQGIAVPEFIGSMKSLRHLNLSYASFGGFIPASLGKLSSLRYLDLTVDPYSIRGLWVSDLHWLSGLSSLNSLRLVGVNLSRASDHWFDEVAQLSSLVELSLFGCELSKFPNHSQPLNFTSLTSVDFSSNNFHSSIPKWVFEIGSLVELQIMDANLVGDLPAIQEASLCNLRKLRLAFNNLTGNIQGIVTGLSGCRNSSSALEVLDLTVNKFSGALPDPLGFLRYLRVLQLSENTFSGPIPSSLVSLSRLEVLDLSFNEMNGTTPNGIGRLSELTTLNLFSNSWEGNVSEDHFHNLTKLTGISLSSAKLGLLAFRVSRNWMPVFDLESIRFSNCIMGPRFPEWLKHQKNLSTVVLSRTEISGRIPNWLWIISPQIEQLDLSGNRIAGNLPPRLSFGYFSRVNLASNRLEGPFPLWSGVNELSFRNNLLSGEFPAVAHLHLPELKYLDVANNSLTGKLPSSISKLKSLAYLDMSQNSLSGKVFSNWTEMPNLKILDLSRNNLSGSIPGKMCSFFPSLEWLKLSMNGISGRLSSATLRCPRLSTLDLGENRLHGPIPKWTLPNLDAISELILRANNFTGGFPEELCHSENLHVLDLSDNHLSGSIPGCVADMVGMKSYGHYYQLPLEFRSFYKGSIELNTKQRQMQYLDLIPLVNMIDLSRNNLSGEIPEGITRLSFLGVLRLSENRLSGNIPRDLPLLTRLETLDLSMNRISGTIPASMSSMTFLVHLNLSYNNLSGPIPWLNQFRTYNMTVFEGNPGLCGLPLRNSCSTPADGGQEGLDDDGARENRDKDDRLIDLWFYISTGSGFFAGFWSVCGLLVAKRSWRHAYFNFLDRVNDSLYLFVVLHLARIRRKLRKRRDSLETRNPDAFRGSVTFVRN